MGGTLGASETAPSFTVSAMKDPDGANLDRIQIIKGWVDDNGDQQEEIIEGKASEVELSLASCCDRDR